MATYLLSQKLSKIGTAKYISTNSISTHGQLIVVCPSKTYILAVCRCWPRAMANRDRWQKESKEFMLSAHLDGDEPKKEMTHWSLNNKSEKKKIF